MNMKPYKGLVKISCETKKTCPQKLTGNVKPACLECLEALTEILDLDHKPLASARLTVNKSKISKVSKP